jgi:hypothetical protein
VVVERGDLGGAGLPAPVVVQVVAGDAEQPAAQRLHRAAEARQALERADEDAAGELPGVLAVAHLGHEEPQQRRRVGGVDAGDGGRVALPGGHQVGLGQAAIGGQLIVGVRRSPSLVTSGSVEDASQLGGRFLAREGVLETPDDRISTAERLLSHRVPPDLGSR